jgi:anaerobic selenocysteine-containing dehydrogenase
MDCPDTCSLVISTDDSGNLHLTGNPRHPITKGFTCRKIKGHLKRLRHPKRILAPQLRQGDHFVEVDWETALDLCARHITDCRREPASILHVHGNGAKGVVKKASKLFFSHLGASQIQSSMCDVTGFEAYQRDFGSRRNNHIMDLEHAKSIVNWGRDLKRSSIHLAAVVQKVRKNGTRVLTVSPGGDDSAKWSDDHVRIRPGTDRFLAAAVMRLLVEEDAIPGFIADRVSNWEAFMARIQTLSVDQLLSVCEVDREDFRKIFRYYGDAAPTATLVATGLQRYSRGGENVRFINALALVSGNMGIQGGGSHYHLSSLRHFNLDWIPPSKGHPRATFLEHSLGRDILAARNPDIRMLWIDGINIVNQAPEPHTTMRAFQRVPFKVVVDAFMTDTAARADLILPAALMLEQEDMIGSFMHEYIQHVPKVIKPPGQARSDYTILSELGRHLSPSIDLPDVATCLRKALDSENIGVSLESLREKGFTQATEPWIPYEGLIFDHADEKACLVSELHPEPDPPRNYPLRLLSLIRGSAIHSQIAPEDQSDPPTIWISSETASLNHIDAEKPVLMVSPLGRMRVAMEYIPGLHPGTVIYRRGDWISKGGGVNRIIAAGMTDMGNGSPYYDQYVRLENADQ